MNSNPPRTSPVAFPSGPPSRRNFLKSSTLAFPYVGLGLIGTRAAPTAAIQLGFIGVGNHGHQYNLKSFLQQDDCRAVAVCDVFKSRCASAKQTIDAKYGTQDCNIYHDFRELLASDEIDAVVISTPDHWHVPLSMFALDAGKDVFCEKPTLTIAEGRKLVEKVAEKGAIFQTGLEDRSVSQYYKLAEAVRNGAIGDLKTIHCGLPYKARTFPVESGVPVPDDLNYKMWLGPAPEAPYSPWRVHKDCWRQIRDYSGGTLTDWGAHIMDTAQVANFAEKSGPIAVEGSGSIPKNCLNSIENQFDLTYTYKNGVKMHVKAEGVYLRFEGTEGWVGNKGWRGGLEAHDRMVFRNQYEDSKIWKQPPGEHRDFLDSVHSREQPAYTAEDLQRLSTAMHIGNIALQLGRPLKWNPDSEAFVDDAEADKLRSRPASEDWKNA